MTPFVLSLIFGIGIVFQALLFVGDFWNPIKIKSVGTAAGASFMGMLPGKHERDYVGDIYFHMCSCFVIFAFVIFANFKKEILPRIGETCLLSYSLILWLLLFPKEGINSAFDKVAMVISVLPTLGVLVISFTLVQWNFTVNLICYIWFLVLTLTIYAVQISFGELAFLFNPNDSPASPAHLFLTGMSFTYLSASVFYLYILIPIQKKHQTREERMKQWREDAGLMASRFIDYRMTPVQALFILVLQGGFYALNHYLRLLPVPMVVSISIILVPYLYSIAFSRAQARVLKRAGRRPAAPEALE
jgi:hypothetical protein